MSEFLAGLLLGVLHFEGLRATLRGSAARVVLTSAGLALLATDGQAALVAFSGFFVGRALVLELRGRR